MKKQFSNTILILLLSFPLGVKSQTFLAPGIKELNLSSFISPNQREVNQELLDQTPLLLRNHPEFGILPNDAPCEDCFELLEKRTSNTKFYIKKGTAGTKFFSQASYTDLHYKDENGDILTINSYLSPSADNPNVYEAKNQTNPTTLNLTHGFTSIQLMDKSTFIFNKTLSVYWTEDLNTKNVVQHINRSQYTVGADGAQIFSAFKNIDQQLIFGNASVKSNYIIKDATAINKDYKYFVVEEIIELPSGYSIKIDQFEGEKNKFGFWHGELILENENGIEMGRFQKPLTFDSDTNNLQNTYLPDIAGYLIEQTDNICIIKIVVDNDWMTVSERIFPIIIDPTVFGTTTTWTGTAGMDDSPTFCSTILSVPTPANATLTGSSIHWEIFTLGNAGSCGTGGCKIKHMQVKICTTCDCSPGGAGIWGSIANFAGLWLPTVDDATTADLVTCYTPQCASFNIPFTVYYNQYSCITPGGCVNTCAYLQRLDIIIEGETVKATALAEGATAYTVVNCADQSGFLSASTPNYGVPGYTYTWTPGPLTGSPVYVVFPMGVTVYTLTITDACGNTATDNVTVTNNCLLLPIDLLSFSGYNQDKKNYLNWVTASEKNNSGFIIERSPTGLQFEPIGNVDGNGTTQQNSNYGFIDNDPFEGVNYYRLKQVDENEEFSYSNIIAINSGEVTNTHVTVNNEKFEDNTLNLTIFSTTAGQSDIFIYDMTGAAVASHKLYVGTGANTVNLQIPSLAKGVYILSFVRGAETAETKFIY